MDQHAFDLATYFRKESVRRRPYGGQLTPSFQHALAAYHNDIEEPDCEFYHSITLPDGRVMDGAWDLRGHEADYLGGIPLAGKTVLEYGPASGFLSRAIVEAGADLTVFDLPIGHGPEIMPFGDITIGEAAISGAHSAGRLRNSWWYVKRAFGFEARAVYADIFHQPDDLGTYDIAIFGAILVHLSNPFQALREAAAVTRDTMIITDLVSLPPIPQLPGLMQIGTSAPPIGHIHWWNYSTSAFEVMLSRLGFANQTVTLHSPRAMADQPPMVTIVAHRN
ncbi:MULTISPECIES: class I SAM-dependent methyltransferase [Acidiphilium]|uniref:O-methyltransferase n=1 Tax=Acidiphilium rubrum TaxID=526 RepID=A0A8G2CK62_ACIRU|nr:MULTISPECIES: class I SAM-dependent methyltransferase [Acidiphilium]SIQ39665.1 O-methyltransferase [Acidiphilium rubrum]